MSRDALSDILSLLNARSAMSSCVRAGGDWAIRFSAPTGIKFSAVVVGSCWLAIDDLEPVRFETGDACLIKGGRRFVLASDLGIDPVDADAVYQGAVGRVARLGVGEDVYVVGGRIYLDEARGSLLTDVLPPLIYVAASSPEAVAVRWLLDKLAAELAVDRPGAALATNQLAQLMFVEMLRVHLAAPGPFPAGWLRALGDPRIAPALQLMHGDPAKPWTLRELAEAAAMSRTAFAFRFKAVMGEAPLAYLAGWRMRLAEHALRESDVSISTLAFTLGYASQSAFSNAFKRKLGSSPQQYRVASRMSRVSSGKH